MRLFATFVVLALLLRAQAPLKIEKICSAEDVEFFGLPCSEDDPCPVFLELAAVETNGLSLFLTGNLHTVNTTLFALLLKSDDAGKTWTEPQTRIRSAALTVGRNTDRRPCAIHFSGKTAATRCSQGGTLVNGMNTPEMNSSTTTGRVMTGDALRAERGTLLTAMPSSEHAAQPSMQTQAKVHQRPYLAPAERP